MARKMMKAKIMGFSVSPPILMLVRRLSWTTCHGDDASCESLTCLNNNSEHESTPGALNAFAHRRKDRREILKRATAALIVIKSINMDLRPTPARCTEPGNKISEYTAARVR